MAAVTFEELNKSGKSAFNRLIINIQNSLAMHDKNASNKLSKSLKSRFEFNSNVFSFKLFGNDYWKFVDKGVRGAKNSVNTTSPYSFKTKRPPFKAIEAWARLRGIIGGNDKKDRGIVFGIQKKIFEKGYLATDIFTDNLEFFKEKEEEKLKQAALKDIQRMITQLANGK